MCFASNIVQIHKNLLIVKAKANKLNHSRNSIPSLRENIQCEERMSRGKSRAVVEVCGDCGASDPSWASINRGILLCSDCCSIHRSLGRHISIIKSLRQGSWEPSVLNFVNLLNAHGANSVWEHQLLDGTINTSSKSAVRMRKPTPKDSLHPVKSDFIKAKHVNLAFVLKPNLHDDHDVTSSNIDQELSRQLHASVRTSNLETSLRLLVQGADPNFFHEEKRSTPLHVSAKFGQASQIELLIIYGADINVVDGNGLTPLDIAIINNHSTISERLQGAMYDVVDRLIMFLSGSKPDHTSGRQLVLPEANNAEISEQLKIARGRLQLVPNKMFEELVMDLYDEVDRRENEAIWATSTFNAENVTVPFLPANPFLSATRNQGRQKLARFSRSEFAGLLTDVLIDARRRQNMANLRPLNNPISNTSYNYTSTLNTNDNEHNLSDDEPIYDPVASDDDYAPVTPAIGQQPPYKSQLEMESLRRQINDYVSEINQLKTVVKKLSSENTELKSKIPKMPESTTSLNKNASIYDEPLRIESSTNQKDIEPNSLPIENFGGVISNSSSASNSTNNSNQSTIKRPASMYEHRKSSSFGVKANDESRATLSMYQLAYNKSFGEEVKLRTDLVTSRLKELVQAMHDVSSSDTLLVCAERIRVSVLELIALFSTSSNCNETIKEILKQLTRYNILIQHECENFQKSYQSDDKVSMEKYKSEVRGCAYHIASAIKTIVVQFDHI